MSIFAQTRLGELYKLIAKDNPQLVLPPDAKTTNVGSIKAISGSKNTQATLTGIKYSGYRGSVNVKYNRIDLGTLFKNVSPSIAVPPATAKTVAGVLPWLNDQLGLYLESGDFTDSNLVMNPSTMLFEGTLTPVAGHPLYIGSLTFVVYGYVLDLPTLLTVRDLGVCVDNSVHVTGKYCQTLLTYGVDYSSISSFLATLPNPKASTVLTDAVAKALTEKLRTVGDQPWVWDSIKNRDFNLRGASIYMNDIPVEQYAGSALNPPPNSSYDRVAIIQLNSSYNVNIAPGGNGWWLFLHYDLVEV